MDLRLTDADLAFQQEVRSFLNEALTPELKRAGERTHGTFSDYEAAVAWQKILHEKGWLAIDWPKEYGGTGWDLSKRSIFREECVNASAPQVIPMGLELLGPIIIEFGTDKQKQEILPRILSAEDMWCQGFSEPGSGSDLASLQLRAERDGEEFVLNGSKIWTSMAHHANRIFCLVRTRKEGKPQAGISFLLVDLDTPGIKVDPIYNICDEVELCQEFFDNVRVPVSNLVGKEGQGWEIAKFLLQIERGGIALYPGLNKHLRQIRKMIEVNGLQDDPLINARLAELDIDTRALEYTEKRMKALLISGGNPGSLTSLIKVIGTELSQRIDELGLEVRGEYVTPLQNDRLKPEYSGEFIGPEEGAIRMSYYLNNRASTIYGGAAQVQRNIIAKTVLGL